MKKSKADLIASRRARAFSLRASGATLREVAIAMRSVTNPETGELMYPKYSLSAASRDVQAVLAELREERLEMAADYLDMQLQALDMASKAIAHRVKTGELLAIDRWLGIIDRRMRLLGLEAPVKLQVAQNLEKELEGFLTMVERIVPPDLYREILEAVVKAGDRAKKSELN
ncbi:MAG: hypothetical protein WBA57_27470 [Elainellaceae cyanobacterium]